MFCPICRAEYEVGITYCVDCEVDLVPDLPPLPEPVYVDYEEVLSTYNMGDIAIIQSILDKEEIKYYFKGMQHNIMRPLAEPAILMVKKDQAQKAREVPKDLKLSFMGFSIDKDAEEK